MSNTGFTTTLEARDEVGTVGLLFQTGLGRAVDSSGFNAYVPALGSGLTALELARSIVDSPEFAARNAGLSTAETINQMYLDVLGRPAEPEGITHWLQYDLATALDGISRSTEALVKQSTGIHGLEDAAIRGTVGDNSFADLADYSAPPQVVNVPGETVYVDRPGETVYVDRPGETVFVDRPVPGPTVVVDKPDVVATTHSPLDTEFVNARGALYQGDGTTPAQGFSSVDDPTSGLLLGVEITPRQTDTAFGGTTGGYLPTGSTFDGKTLHVTYDVPAGPQSTTNGSFQDVANRGAVNSNIVVGLHESVGVDFGAFLETGNTITLDLDRDASVAVSSVRLVAIYDATNDTLDFVAPGTTSGFTDFKGNGEAPGHVASESVQQNFLLPDGVKGLTVGAIYDNTLSVHDAQGNLVEALQWTLNFVPAGFSPADQLSPGMLLA